MEHDQSSYFCRNPDNFCWGPAPVGPTLVTGLRAVETINCLERRPINQKVKMRPPKNASVVSVAENLKYSPVYTIVLCLVAIRFCRAILCIRGTSHGWPSLFSSGLTPRIPRTSEHIRFFTFSFFLVSNFFFVFAFARWIKRTLKQLIASYRKYSA